MADDFIFEQDGRRSLVALVLGVVWAVLAAAWLWMEAALWIVALLGAFTLPALRDLIRNPSAGLTLTDRDLTWHTGRYEGALDLSEVQHMRLDTRLDFSVRATAVLKSGRKIRLPFEATPPHRAFETALEARGLRVKRFHFQLMQ
ncbi:hypothetical protein [Sulfitobacter sp. JB4-11]|uniref:hypothetical protein n=1 Tax=Sulfitobacter rhodophyticola TaxID=3238304 RepID=UPI003519AD76